MKEVRLANLLCFVDDDNNLNIADGDEIVGHTTVADALVTVEALHALLRYAAIGDDNF